MRRIELRAFRMQSEHSTTELHPRCKIPKSIYISVSQFENIFNNTFLAFEKSAKPLSIIWTFLKKQAYTLFLQFVWINLNPFL